MKNNLYFYAICTLMGVLCCYSCYDDKGNYTYRDINEVAISGLEESYTMRAGEGITIKPVIESTIYGNEENYSYEWVVVYHTRENEPYYDYVWSTLKEWDDFNLTLPAGTTYKLYYRITDNETGVKWSSDIFTVQIINDIAQGFFILSEVNGIGRVDFINYAHEKFDLRLDMLTRVGSGIPPLDKPIGVACVSDNNSPYMGASLVTGENYHMVGVLTEKGMYRLHPSTLLYEEKYEIKQSILLDHLLPSDFYVKKVLCPAGSSRDFVLMDNHNNLYYNMGTFALYSTAGVYTNSFANGHRMNISEWAVYPSSSYTTVMYDTDSLSFARQTGTTVTVSNYYPASNEREFEDGKFKFNKTGMELVYLHFRAVLLPLSGAPIYSIQKNPTTGEYYLGCFLHSGVQQYYHRLKNLPEFSDRKEIAMTYNSANKNLANNYLYYRTDTKIYAYDINNQTTELVFTTEEGEKISYMQFMQPGLSSYVWKDRMILCTYNPNLPAEHCGTLRVLATDAVYGTLSPVNYNGEEMIWTGFGKIIDLSWKEK